MFKSQPRAERVESCEASLYPDSAPQSDSKPDVHLKTCSCLGHGAEEQLQLTQTWLTEITSSRVCYVIRDIIQGNAYIANSVQ